MGHNLFVCTHKWGLRMRSQFFEYSRGEFMGINVYLGWSVWVLMEKYGSYRFSSAKICHNLFSSADNG